jgi:hypothetical protein
MNQYKLMSHVLPFWFPVHDTLIRIVGANTFASLHLVELDECVVANFLLLLVVVAT